MGEASVNNAPCGDHSPHVTPPPMCHHLVLQELPEHVLCHADFPAILFVPVRGAAAAVGALQQAGQRLHRASRAEQVAT